MADSEFSSVDGDKAFPRLLEKVTESIPTAGDEDESKQGKLNLGPHRSNYRIHRGSREFCKPFEVR